jgi:hypothetical protein
MFWLVKSYDFTSQNAILTTLLYPFSFLFNPIDKKKKTKQKLKIDFEWLKTIENVPKKGELEKHCLQEANNDMRNPKAFDWKVYRFVNKVVKKLIQNRSVLLKQYMIGGFFSSNGVLYTWREGGRKHCC